LSGMIARLGTFQDRVLNGTGWRGPAFLVFLGVVPILVALAIGAWDSWPIKPAGWESWEIKPVLGDSWEIKPAAGDLYRQALERKLEPMEFMGYGTRPNWYLLPLLLPIGLLLLRQMTQQVADWRNDGLPLLQQFDEGKPREFVRDRLKAISTDYRMFLTALLVNVLIHSGALYRVVRKYFTARVHPELPDQPDWCSYFLIEHLVPASAKPPDVTPLENGLLVATAYLCTFAIVLLGLLLVGILLRGNLLYLSLIYRRSGASASRDISTTLVLNFNDPECCLGLRKLNAIFNVQVRFACIAGLFILVGRYATVRVSHPAVMLAVESLGKAFKGDLSALSGLWSQLTETGLFPYTDQILLAFGWIAATAVVGMPALVKFLPLLTPGARNSRKEYLLQFVPLGSVPNEEDLDRETLDKWASGFARNSFWPTGDSRAFLWYTFVFGMLLVVLFPVCPDSLYLGLLYIISIVVASSVFASAFFNLLRKALWCVDHTLVKPVSRDSHS